MLDAITQLSQNIFLIAGEGRAQFPYCNTLIVKDREILVVDPGAGTQRLNDSFNQLDIRIRDIDFLLLTHYHYDHRGQAADIQRASECKVLAHASDAPAVEDATTFKKFTGIHGSPFEADWDHLFKAFFRTGTCQVNSLIHDGDHLSLGDTDWEILHTPGHTPGHVALYESGTKILFTADVDLTRFGPWYGNLTSDLTAFRSSVQRLSNMVMNPKLEPITVITGHRLGPVNNPIQAFNTYAKHFDTRDKRILGALEGPLTLDQLIDCNIFYSEFSFPILRFFEKIMLEKHLALLQEQGYVTENPSGTWCRLENKDMKNSS
ncbi:MAG: MBL fold metallo-hydrolase [Promethearchaeota archaeon]